MKIKWNNRDWSWNPIDKHLLMVNDWTNDFNHVLPYLDKTRGAIQAGGAMGLWPYLISQKFEKVYTFEASPDNYKHLSENMSDISNVSHYNKALGATNGFCDINLPPSEKENAGCYYSKESPTGKIEQIALDDFIEGPIDFIQLDVEGHELNVLHGAKRLIEEYSPIIMLEDKRLPHSAEIGHCVGDVEKYLISINYEVVKRVHKDIIFRRNT
jgi:FkbM family methyltransferase